MKSFRLNRTSIRKLQINKNSFINKLNQSKSNFDLK